MSCSLAAANILEKRDASIFRVDSSILQMMAAGSLQM
jgi:hypothetical protein